VAERREATAQAEELKREAAEADPNTTDTNALLEEITPALLL
jgi:hypothetical protein